MASTAEQAKDIALRVQDVLDEIERAADLLDQVERTSRSTEAQSAAARLLRDAKTETEIGLGALQDGKEDTALRQLEATEKLVKAANPLLTPVVAETTAELRRREA